MDTWECKCGHLVLANHNPTPIKWDDGHICILYVQPPPEPCWLCQTVFTLYESEMCQECYYWALESGFTRTGDTEATVRAWYAVEQMRMELGIHGPNGSVYDCDGLPWESKYA